MEGTACVPGQASEIRNFLAQPRIPIRVCRRNMQPIDTVHTEHRNADPWAGKKILALLGWIELQRV
jgi:hypothetical protein